jgi:nucleoside phosphorylase
MSEETTDVAILTVIPAELHAALAAFGIPEENRRKDKSGTVYYYGQLTSALCRRSFSVMIGCIGMAGNPSAAAATTEFIQSHQPKVFFLLGIAAGVRGKVKIGEVVFSDRVVAYEPEALLREAGRTWAEPRPDIDRIPHTMNQDLMAYRGDLARIAQRVEHLGLPAPKPGFWQKKAFRDHVAGEVALRIATIASGEKLLRDPAKLHAIRNRLHGKVEVGEMEAAGVVAACSRKGIPWLVVRGISDFGDRLKNDAFHGYAAGRAAAALADFIEHGLDLGRAEEARAAQTLAFSLTELTWPYADFSVVNMADHPVQVTAIRTRRLAMLPHTHMRLKGDRNPSMDRPIPMLIKRIGVSVSWEAPQAADRFNVLGPQVLNLKAGEAAAFRLDLSAHHVIALVALELDWISARSPQKRSLWWPEFLAVHGSYTSENGHGFQEGALSVVNGQEAIDCLVDARPPGLWQGQPFADCGWKELVSSSVAALARADPAGAFEKLRQAYESEARLLASFTEVYLPSEGHLRELLESSMRMQAHQRPPRVDEEKARVIIDWMLAPRQGSETEWILDFIDDTLDECRLLLPLQSAALKRLQGLPGGPLAEYLLALILVMEPAPCRASGLLNHLVDVLGSLPSPPPADLLSALQTGQAASSGAAEQQLLAWWKQARHSPGLALFNWRLVSPRLARFWDMLLRDANEKELAEAVQSPEMLERYAVAMRADLPDSIVHALAREAHDDVKRALARNPAAPWLPMMNKADVRHKAAASQFHDASEVTFKKLEDGVGFIHIPHFDDSRIVEGFDQALQQLRKTWGLVLDVRDASLGEANITRQLLERLLQENQPWAYKGPVVVFLNRWSTPVATQFATELDKLERATVIRARLIEELSPLLADARQVLRQRANRLPAS